MVYACYHRQNTGGWYQAYENIMVLVCLLPLLSGKTKTSISQERRYFLKIGKKTHLGIFKRNRLTWFILKSYGWKSQEKQNKMACKIHFIVDNLTSFYSNRNRKKNPPGEFWDLSKSGLRIVLRKKRAPGKTKQDLRVFWEYRRNGDTK